MQNELVHRSSAQLGLLETQTIQRGILSVEDANTLIFVGQETFLVILPYLFQYYIIRIRQHFLELAR